ncbi:hypothetical protein DPMN_156821 [Dreissena polymorpha]|uniref:Uncharacterized protein n=1 Tax=Dreissena polymorpha TaxID=45954 RepID=A0A9D4JB56_DREPO|nr:hypothetical protein DPMN_156821 [Dreissena polymorpha]
MEVETVGLASMGGVWCGIMGQISSTGKGMAASLLAQSPVLRPYLPGYEALVTAIPQ